MTDSSIRKLAELGSESLSPGSVQLPAGLQKLAGAAAQQLNELLSLRNGLYCFESALHVFPAQSERMHIGLPEWNARDLWKHAYGGLMPLCVFFAEDVFGGQFCIFEEQISTFDPETGELKPLAGSIVEWTQKMLLDYQLLSGYPLAHKWQQQHGKLPAGQRLVPKIPFVLGGDFSVENLYAADAAAGMRVRGDLARQLVDLPDGAQVQYRVAE